MEEKYLERLSEYGKLGGYRCCPVDDADVEEVKKIFSTNDYYYFTSQDGETWLNWE